MSQKSYSSNYNLFAIPGEDSLLEDRHVGIINGFLTTNANPKDVLSLYGLHAPPFFSPDFALEMRLFGRKVPTTNYTWRPVEVERHGQVEGLKVDSSLVLVHESCAMILSFTVTNPTGKAVHIPAQVYVNGKFDSTTQWQFGWPATDRRCRDTAQGRRLILSNAAGAIVVETNLPRPEWRAFSHQWETQVTIPARSSKTFWIALSAGKKTAALKEIQTVSKNPTRTIEQARRGFSDRVADLFNKLPRLEADCPQLVRWYDRSLMHLLMNQWRSKEFMLRPYYSTGGLLGGCVCSYLWDFGENWEIINLYDPKALREHVKAFLGIDLTNHYAFLPFTGEAFGPWYYINQEKIIFLIYYYVLHTGDTGFLKQKAHGKTIIDHVIEQALVGDDLKKDAVLVDYGAGNHHLELRKEYRYDHYLPDMNARRYAYYHAADALCKLAGKQPPVDFPKRAEAIRKLVTKKMWNPKLRWFHWLDAKGKKQLRYTVQMFKLLDSEVLGREQRQGLLSHLNEKEFLSAYGLHSMAKHDPAYDQVDIDNGGGGCCTCFPPQIIEKLYKAGLPKKAEDILRRILWWADRLPYWSDSIVANYMDYRKDTPLQSALGSVAAAQAIIFGLFGVRVNDEREISVKPQPPSFCKNLALRSLRIRGEVLDIVVKGSRFTVRHKGKTFRAKLGETVTVR
ncbi:MAG: hypothetical protein JXA11_00990 [Phycisphaerae bacterium]|nr:hypothetical protein [Phycisphaerae bacterium]